MLKTLLRTTCLTPVMLIAMGVQAGELPAVSQANGVLTFDLGGDDTGLWLRGDGRFAVGFGPVGAQADFNIDAIEGSTLYGAAAHLFLRDPSVGLAGLYGSGQVDETGAFNGRVGAEAELYLGPVTASGLVTTDKEGDVDAKGRLSAYVTDQTKLYFGIEDIKAEELSAGLEQGLGGGLALFAEANYDRTDESFAVLGGIRVQFAGEERTLIQRDREDVAPLWKIVDRQQIEASASPSSSVPYSPPPLPSIPTSFV